MTSRTKLIVQLAAVLVIGTALRLTINKLGWNTSSLRDDRLFPSVVLWLIFGIYWSVAGLNSAPTQSSESRASTFFHQFLLGVAFLLVVLRVPGLNGWFLPPEDRLVIAIGVVVQAAFLLLAVWARRHLGRNWSAEVRIGEGHELVTSGPYRRLRHPIYTAMLGMLLGTAIVSSQYHALLGVALLLAAYLRKTRLEDQVLLRIFGADYNAYRRITWALLPFVY